VHETLEAGHGRIERRTIQTSTALNDPLDFPYVRQIARVQRTTIRGDSTRDETVYRITRVAPERGDAARLLALNRGHWAIENPSH
jgi:hypothetical protein